MNKGVVYALISSGTFGLIPLFSIPIISNGMDNMSILFYRFLFSTLMIGSICLIQRKSFKIETKKLVSLSVLGVLYAATALGLLSSYKYISSGIATTIHFLYPVMVALLMVLFFKEDKSKSLGVATILSITGVALLCWSGNSSLNPVGLTLAISTIFSYSLYIVGVNKAGVDKIDPLVLTFYILMFGAIIFGGVAFLNPEGISAIPNIPTLVNLLLLAFLATVISDLTLILAIKYAGSVTTSILGSMEPLVAVAIGILHFSEQFGTNSFIGLILVLTSVLMVILVKKKPQTTSLPDN